MGTLPAFTCPAHQLSTLKSNINMLHLDNFSFLLHKKILKNLKTALTLHQYDRHIKLDVFFTEFNNFYNHFFAYKIHIVNNLQNNNIQN